MPAFEPRPITDMFGVPLTESQVEYLAELKRRLSAGTPYDRISALEETLALQAFTMSNMRSVIERSMMEIRTLKAQMEALLQRPVNAKIPTINPFIKPFPEG